jgi:UTP--glucose-1-phosphate uridylyltransferase
LESLRSSIPSSSGRSAEPAAPERPGRRDAGKGLDAGLRKMRNAGMPEVALRAFRCHYQQLLDTDAGMLPESRLEPVHTIPGLGDLSCDEDGARELVKHTVVLKLNGGLGTSMGLSGPKSLLAVKDGLTFLDLTASQLLTERRRSQWRIPLVLMNSSATDGQTQGALCRHPDLASDVGIAFVQNSFPKLRPEDLMPASWPANRSLEWAPPGHGDLYTSIAMSGMLGRLLSHDYRYAFVSNSDNLGAVLDQRILAWFAAAGTPFVMEVADRTDADRKGGHLACLRGDGLVLRESAQTPEADLGAFQDVTRHRYFNTNNLWVDLRALARVLQDSDGFLRLPLIVNHKPVDPSDPSTPEVIQLESAMGAAIGVFEGARALRVPRSRFSPVKTTDDLLAVRSDAYVRTEEGHVELARGRAGQPPVIELDPRFYRLLPDFEDRFPAGPPSLVACERLRVVGDVRFGRDIVVRGSVVIEHSSDGQLQLEDGVVLDGCQLSDARLAGDGRSGEADAPSG